MNCISTPNKLEKAKGAGALHGCTTLLKEAGNKLHHVSLDRHIY
jgi:hypothetical protein